jgi:hypothetical protein
VKGKGLLSPTHGLRSIRENSTPGNTSKLKLVPVEPHTCKASILKQYEGCADNALRRYRLGLQLAGCEDLHQTEENMKFQRGQPRWDMEKLYAQ